MLVFFCIFIFFVIYFWCCWVLIITAIVLLNNRLFWKIVFTICIWPWSVYRMSICHFVFHCLKQLLASNKSRLYNNVDCYIPICDILTYNVCLLCSHIVCDVTKYYTRDSLTTLFTYTARFYPPFFTHKKMPVFQVVWCVWPFDLQLHKGLTVLIFPCSLTIQGKCFNPAVNIHIIKIKHTKKQL